MLPLAYPSQPGHLLTGRREATLPHLLAPPGVWVVYEARQNDHAAEQEACQLVDAARRQDIPAHAVDADQVFVINSPQGDQLWDVFGNQLDLPSCALVRSGALTSEHTMTLLQTLERQGTEVVPSPRRIRPSARKFQAQQAVAAAGIPVPHAALVPAYAAFDPAIIQQTVGFPAVLKLNNGVGTCGAQVHVVDGPEELVQLQHHMSVEQKGEAVLVQAFCGRLDQPAQDLRVLMIGGEPVAAMRRTAAEGERVSNYSCGGSVHPVSIDADLAALSRRVCQALGLQTAGIDWIQDAQGRYRFCEANVSPGFTGISLAHPDIDFADRIVEAHLAPHRTETASYPLPAIQRTATDGEHKDSVTRDRDVSPSRVFHRPTHATRTDFVAPPDGHPSRNQRTGQA